MLQVEETQFNGFFEHIKSMNVIDLRLTFSKRLSTWQKEEGLGAIRSQKTIDELLDYLQSNPRLRDLELAFFRATDVKKVLQALDSSFMIRKVVLDSVQEVDEETIQIADEFCKQRMATEVKLNTSCKKFRKHAPKVFKTYYPD